MENFDELMYYKLNSWQPSPMIFSLSTGIRFPNTVLNEWVALAAGAKRNIPILVIGPEAYKDIKVADQDSMWAEDVREMARQRQIELLAVWNLTMKAKGLWRTRGSGLRSREEVALVEAMMVINWLLRLETS